MKTSFITTVFNEQEQMPAFIKSLFTQTKNPNEIIIVDGGSSDNTVAEVKNQISHIKSSIIFKIIVKKGNRSVGRNEAIRHATGKIILCSDAGCVLDRDWVKNIVGPFANKNVDVVAGYYKGSAQTIFEKCLVPYVLVMEDKVNPQNFLPVTRSMVFKKSIWKKVGGFPEAFSHNEDYVFAKRLKEINANIVFEKKAIAYWTPRSNLKDAFIMFYRFAKGDSESRIFRPKVILIFARYIVFSMLILLFLITKSYFILNTLYLILPTYVLWSIVKNYKYVNSLKALFYLPQIQIVSDISVMLGTLAGFI